MSEFEEDWADEGPDEETETARQAQARTKTDRAIEREFSEGRLRVIQEKNDLFLPHVVDFIKGRKWGNLRPEYQRRLRWSQGKKSKLIESFIMNVPVPPVFLYEASINRYEVMDGQQRLNAITEFLENEFALAGLEIWPSLNGKTFKQLPSLIRKGIERSKLSAITLVSDLGGELADGVDLRAQVFDRLNTGGEKLNAQELRNSLYGGPFNKLLIRLSAHKQFTKVWGIPDHEDNTDSSGEISQALKSNNMFKRMLDAEIVLRFFAFRETEFVKGSVKNILDDAMRRNRRMSEDETKQREAEFNGALKVAVTVFGADTFKIEGTDGKKRLSRPLFDAVMIAIWRHLDERQAMVRSKEAIAKAVAKFAKPANPKYPLLVGRANTAEAIRDRIDLIDKAISKAIA